MSRSKCSTMSRFFPLMLCFVALLLFFAFVAEKAESASDFPKIMARWSKEQSFRDAGAIGPLEMKVTFYSAEYVQALIESEAEKNLWTNDEKEQYTYALLKQLNLEETIPVHVDFNNYGPSMYLAPFGDQIVLWAGNKKYQPVDYDKRFNFRLQGQRDGMIFFPRYDEKGKPVLEGVKTVKLSFNGGIHPYVQVAYIDFLWDVHNDNPQRLFAGRTAARFELDRLIKRIEKLNAEKREHESKLSELNAELDTIKHRVEELQRQ